jgi:hypothetical protein
MGVWLEISAPGARFAAGRAHAQALGCGPRQEKTMNKLVKTDAEWLA